MRSRDSRSWNTTPSAPPRSETNARPNDLLDCAQVELDRCTRRGARLVERIPALPVIQTPTGFIAPHARIAARSLSEGLFVVVFADSIGQLHAGTLPIMKALEANRERGLTPSGTWQEIPWNSALDAALPHVLPSKATLRDHARAAGQRVAAILMKSYPDRFDLTLSEGSLNEDYRKVDRIVARETGSLLRYIRKAIQQLCPDQFSDDALRSNIVTSMACDYGSTVRAEALRIFKEDRLHIAHHLFDASVSAGPIRALVDQTAKFAFNRLTAFRQFVSCVLERGADRKEIETAVGLSFSRVLDRDSSLLELWRSLRRDEQLNLAGYVKEFLHSKMTFGRLSSSPLHELVTTTATQAASHRAAYHAIAYNLRHEPLRSSDDKDVSNAVDLAYAYQLEHHSSPELRITLSFLSPAELREVRNHIIDLTWKRGGMRYAESN